MNKLGVSAPHCMSRVTDHVEDIIAFVQQILDMGMAYVAADGMSHYSLFYRYCFSFEICRLCVLICLTNIWLLIHNIYLLLLVITISGECNEGGVYLKLQADRYHCFACDNYP